MVLQRKLNFDERFKLTLTQPWDNDCSDIHGDDDLFSIWSLHNHYGLHQIHLQLEIMSIPVNSSTRKSLFQEPLSNSIIENTAPENPSTINLNAPVNETQTNDIMLKLVPPHPLHTHINGVLQKIPNLQPYLEEHENYNNFVNTFERSPISHQRCTPCNSNVIQQVHIEEGDDEDSSLRFHTPFSQQRQTFNLSESLSPLLLDRISVHQRQEHGVIDQAPISESQPLSLPNTQNHESQVLQALNPNLNQPQNQNFQNTNQSSAKGDERFCSYDSDNAKGDERFYSYDSNNSMYKMFDGDDNDDNEFGPCSDEDGDRLMEVMDAEIRANMYIPSDEPVKFFVGQYFNNFNELTVALRKFAVHERFKTRKDKFKRTIIFVELWKNPECTAKFIASKFQDIILSHPETKASFIMSELNRMYEVRVNKQKVYRAKKIALESGGANFESNYRLIRSYAQMILNKMPNALALVHPIPDKVNWPVVLGDEILPHLVKKQPGRPKLNRIREPDEVPPEKMRYKMQCKCCHEFGHNKRACPINPNNANKKTRHFQDHCKGTHPKGTTIQQL
ncbi:hypothetical protein WN943_029087 [Citrus x changshan-huyou]